jgi:2'-5' RNA ligase
MRLFTAILLDEKSKASIYDTVLQLKANAGEGSFTARENLHLTVNFIGETKRLEEVKHAMQRAVEKAGAKGFDLTLRGFGSFKRREGDIYWVGVLREEVLWRIQRELVRELKEEGFFDIDDREYKPHLTLGRRVRVNPGFDRKQIEAALQPITLEVTGLSLMKSERVEGKLTYTEIYRVKLEH